MRKKSIILVLALAAAAAMSAGSPATAEELIGKCPEKAGGIYYAYDVERDSVAPVPDGYVPVYVSHYGRHGSRWPVNPRIYKTVSDYFQQQQLAENLTQEGRTIWKAAGLCAGNASGHMGELTPLGERQHAAIAGRLARRYPTLLKKGARVEARSSIEPRCIMSMAAFCDGLRSETPGIDIRRHASPGDMDFIHHKTEAAQLLNSDTAPWRWNFHGYRDSVAQCRTAVARLFKVVPPGDSIADFMRCLYDIGISVQDIDGLDADILSIFDKEELTGLWKASNYIQYVGNARSPIGESVGANTAQTLLAEITERADEMLESGDVKADLRFGHDTDLLRLVSLIDLNGYGVEAKNPDEAAEKWRNFEISPMGANLQFIFFRNKDGKIIVSPLLNERPATIGTLPEVAPGYYDWKILRDYFVQLV